MRTVKTFIKFVSPEEKEMAVETRNVEEISLPSECEFYFYDSYVDVIDGVEYTYGPKMNISKHYFKASKHYVNVDYFRVYFMRCMGGWSEEDIWDATKYESSAFSSYTEEEYPNGVVVVNQIITNPKDGIIISAKKTIESYVFPTEEEIKAYKH